MSDQDSLFDDEAVAELSKLIGEGIQMLRRVVYGEPPEPRVNEWCLEIASEGRTLCIQRAPDGFRLEVTPGPYKPPYSGGDIHGLYDPAVAMTNGMTFMYGPDQWPEARALFGQVVSSVRAVRDEQQVVGADLSIGQFVLGCRVWADDLFLTLKQDGEPGELARWGFYADAPLPD